MSLSSNGSSDLLRSEVGKGQPAKHETYKKFNHLLADDCQGSLQHMLSKSGQSGSTLIAKVKHRKYLDNLPAEKLRLSALTLDTVGSLCIVVFQ